MSDIIPIFQTKFNNSQINSIDARTLYEFLEVKSKFATWIQNRIAKYGFIENIDFVTISNFLENGGRLIEYHISIDMAKELSMVENNKKGREARLYFIEKEKEVNQKQHITPQLPQNYVEALEYLVKAEKEKLVLENTIKEKEQVIQTKDKQIENAKALFKQIADKTGCVKFKACARQLSLTDTILRTLLIENGWRQKNKHFPTTKGINGGYVKLFSEEFDVKFKDGNTQKKSSPALYITEKGYCKILEQVSGVLVN